MALYNSSIKSILLIFSVTDKLKMRSFIDYNTLFSLNCLHLI
jgi:hypothetical protein